jgi:predicted MPP superfamily phosphohydrolase
MKIGLFLLLLIPILLLAYAYWIEPHHLVVEQVTITSAKFSPDMDCTIVQMSDPHLDTFGHWEQRVVDRVNRLHPDYIVITGDFFRHSILFEKPAGQEFQDQLNAIRTFLTSLAPRHKILVVRGNNDFSNDKEFSNVFLSMLYDIGVQPLTDQRISIPCGEDTVAILGVDFPEFRPQDVSDFFVVATPSGSVFQSGRSMRNSYSHWWIKDTETHRWRNYTYTGRLRLQGPAHAIGVTLYSQFHRGLDRFYRLRCYREHPSFHLSAHGTQLISDSLDTGVVPEPDIWYRFRIEVQTEPDQTVLRARIWPDHETEPPSWQATAIDTHQTRLRAGTVGVWSAKFGTHQYDDLWVFSAQKTLLRQDFDHTPAGRDPLGWVDFNYHHEALPVLMDTVADTTFSILLAHSPDLIQWAAPSGIDLVISGHTHGGQVQLPFWGPIINRTALKREHLTGLSHFGETRLYVNRGMGTILLPLRFLSPPEVTLFSFQPELKSTSGDENREPSTQQ